MALNASLRAQLLRPRRLLIAAVLFVVLGGSMGGLMGLVSASDGSHEAGVLQPFTLALPMSGDHGSYQAEDAQGRPSATGSGLEFTWLDDQVVRGADGEAHWANLVRLQGESGGRSLGADRVLALVPGSTLGFATFDAGNGTARDGANGASVSSSNGPITSSRVYVEEDFTATDALPCGFRPPLSGQPLASLHEVRTVAHACEEWSARGPAVSLELQSTAVGAGKDYLVAAEGDENATQYWYRADVPYPVRIQFHGGSAWQLASFARGSGAVRSTPENPVGALAPSLTFTAPNAIGTPEETGATHPFPLSVAFARAKEDFADLRDFLDAHPGSYIAQARYSAMVSAGWDSDSHSWRFTVTDGSHAQSFAVRLLVEKSMDPTGVAMPKERFDYSSWAAEDSGGKYPLPADTPKMMPTVASQWAAWRAFASPEYAAQGPNDWGFAVGCGTDCLHARVMYWAGLTHYNRTYASPEVPFVHVLPNDPIDSQVQSALLWRGDAGDIEGALAHPQSYDEDRTDWSRPGQSAPAVTEPPVSAMRAATAMAGLWTFPTTGQAAAIGLGGLLASLVYWLWPAIKAGPAALFSRVRSEDLLGNPLRAEIHQRIEAEPGIHHQALMRAVGRGHGGVEHHLRKLLEGGLVSRVQGKGYTCYFPKGRIDYRAMAAAPLLKSPVARGILEAVRNQPGIRAIELARALAVAPATVHYHVERMRGAGLLEGTLANGALRLHASATAA